MKKLLLVIVMAVMAGMMASAAETNKVERPKYVDPNPFAGYKAGTASPEENPSMAVWSTKHDDEISAATKEDVLASCVASAESAAALLAKVRTAYASDPLALIQIAAVTQWVLLPDPWYCILWDGPHAAGRKVWVDALARRIAETDDRYVRILCRQQLEFCK